ncbi:MAG: hypothetical protein ACOYKZ_06095 [Chlamydiia bacterium]
MAAFLLRSCTRLVYTLFLVVSGGLGAQAIERLSDLRPQSGDLVVLDVDETLICPVTSAVQLWNHAYRERWRSRLGSDWESAFSRYWSSDRRQHVDPGAVEVIRNWRRQGVYVIALTSRSAVRPDGCQAHPQLLSQLQGMGYLFTSCEGVPSGLGITNGGCKASYLLEQVPIARRVPTVWLVDDSKTTLQRARCSWTLEHPSLETVHFCGAEAHRRPFDPFLADYGVLQFLERDDWAVVSF